MSAEYTIIVRQSTGTYIAKALGHKPSASCTAGAKQAAEALVGKLGLPPCELQEKKSTLPYGYSCFFHPGISPSRTDASTF